MNINNGVPIQSQQPQFNDTSKVDYTDPLTIFPQQSTQIVSSNNLQGSLIGQGNNNSNVNQQQQTSSFSKQLTVQYKITPANLRKHKMIKDRLNYHLNKSTDYDSMNKVNKRNNKNHNSSISNNSYNLPNLVNNAKTTALNQDFDIIYSDESMLMDEYTIQKQGGILVDMSPNKSISQNINNNYSNVNKNKFHSLQKQGQQNEESLSHNDNGSQLNKDLTNLKNTNEINTFLHSSMNDSPSFAATVHNNQNANNIFTNNNNDNNVNNNNLFNLPDKVIGRNSDIIIKKTSTQVSNNKINTINSNQKHQLNGSNNHSVLEELKISNDNLIQKSVDSMPPLRQVVMTAFNQNTRYDPNNSTNVSMQTNINNNNSLIKSQQINQQQFRKHTTLTQQNGKLDQSFNANNNNNNSNYISNNNNNGISGGQGKILQYQDTQSHLENTTNAASQYQSSHHFVMSKSVDKTAQSNSKQQQQNLINKYKKHEINNNQSSDNHPYDSNQEDNHSMQRRTNGKGVKKQQLSQATLNKIVGKQARSTSRSFFSRRPKTVQQMLDMHNSNNNNGGANYQSKQQQLQNQFNARKYSSNFDEQQDYLDQIDQEQNSSSGGQNQTFDNNQNNTLNQLINNQNGVLTNSLFKNNPQNQFSTFKEALNYQLESQSLLQKSFQSAQNNNNNNNDKYQQQILNQKLMTKQVEVIKQRLDQKEFEFQNKYGLNQESEKVFNFDKKEMHRELVNIYEDTLKEFYNKVLKKQPQQHQLIERCFQGLKSQYSKLQSLTEIEVHQKQLEVMNYKKEIEMIQKQNEKLQQQLDEEQEYLNNMFEKTKQEGLSKMVTEWENMKSLEEQLNDSTFLRNTLLKRSNTNKQGDGSMTNRTNDQASFNQDMQDLVNSEEGKKFLNDYSGVIFQLKDLYTMMRGNVFYDKHGDFSLDIKSDIIVDKIENEINEKFKNVQSATAMKVLKRFYKKIVYKDQGTNIDEDPVEVERQRLERIIDHMRHERDNDMNKMLQLQKTIDSLQKSMNTVQVQYRETRSMLLLKTEEFDQKEGEIKDLRGQIKYQNDQIIKFQEQVKELMFKCDDYDSRLEMYKESLQYLENKHKKRKIKLGALKEKQAQHQELVDGLEQQITELTSQVKKFEKQTDPERKRIMMVKKPIFDSTGNQIGEGLVEQVITMRTDDSMGYLQSIQHSNFQRSEIGDGDEIDEEDEFDQDDEDSDFTLDQEEMLQLENLLKEKGLDREILQDSTPVNANIAEHKKRFSLWFKRTSKAETTNNNDSSNTAEQEMQSQAIMQAFKEQIRVNRKIKRDEEKERRKAIKKSTKKSAKIQREDVDENQQQDKEDLKNVDDQEESNLLKVSSAGQQDKSNKSTAKPQSRGIAVAKKSALKSTDNSNKRDSSPQRPKQSKADSKQSMSKSQPNPSKQPKKTPLQTEKSQNQDEQDDDNEVIDEYQDKSQNSLPPQKQVMFQTADSNDNNLQTNQSILDIASQKQNSRNTDLSKKQDSTTNLDQNNSVNGGTMQQYDSPREPRVQILHRSKDEIALSDNNNNMNQTKDSQVSQHDKSSSSIMLKSKNSLGQQSSNSPSQLQKHVSSSLERKLMTTQLQRDLALQLSGNRKESEDFFSLQKLMNPDRSQSLYQYRPMGQQSSLPQHSQAYLNYNSKHIQTDLMGEVVKKPNVQGLFGETVHTQTEDFMFPMDEELKQKVMNLIGGRLAKYGDTYDKGSSFFTKATQIIDEIEDRFLIDIEYGNHNNSTMSKKEYYQLRAANGLQDPRYKSFKPVLKTVKNTNTNTNNNNQITNNKQQ